jgi:hypothetical protein
MGPLILHELSQRLAVLLEEGIRSTKTAPVFLCHPLDPLEAREELASHTVGVLYPYRFSPERRFRQPGMALEAAANDAREVLRKAPLWIRARYAFLAAGGGLKDQLDVLGAALRTLHDTPAVALEDGTGAYPLEVIDEPGGWRELGLTEHRLMAFFEVVVPLASARTERVERVLDRSLRLEAAGRHEEGRRLEETSS